MGENVAKILEEYFSTMLFSRKIPPSGIWEGIMPPFPHFSPSQMKGFPEKSLCIKHTQQQEKITAKMLFKIASKKVRMQTKAAHGLHHLLLLWPGPRTCSICVMAEARWSAL